MVEAMISMIIIAIVGMATVPLLTKSKPQIESITLRGQYGCWYEGNTLYEWYLDERSPRTENPEVVDPNIGCRFRLDQRPANFYIIATGAGGQTLPAQVSTRYTHAISNELDIELGRFSPAANITTNAKNDKTTTVYYGSSAEVVAYGTQQSASNIGVIGSNVKSCKLLSAPNCAKSCSVEEHFNYNLDGSIASTSYKVLFNGCRYVDENGSGHTAQVNLSSNISFNGISSSVNLNNITPNSTIVNTLASNNNNMDYRVITRFNSSGGQGLFRFNLEFHDSSFMQPEQILGFRRNTNNRNIPTITSKMANILNAISVRRRSILIDRIINQNPGAPERNGAVLILW